MLPKVSVSLKIFYQIWVLLIAVFFTGCSKDSSNTINVTYQLHTSTPTGDHFYVTYVNENADTVVQHEHPGWSYSFKATKPFNAYLQARVNPIDKYVFAIKILNNGKEVRQDSASTFTGGIKVIQLTYPAP